MTRESSSLLNTIKKWVQLDHPDNGLRNTVPLAQDRTSAWPPLVGNVEMLRWCEGRGRAGRQKLGPLLSTRSCSYRTRLASWGCSRMWIFSCLASETEFIFICSRLQFFFCVSYVLLSGSSCFMLFQVRGKLNVSDFLERCTLDLSMVPTDLFPLPLWQIEIFQIQFISICHGCKQV